MGNVQTRHPRKERCLSQMGLASAVGQSSVFEGRSRLSPEWGTRLGQSSQGLSSQLLKGRPKGLETEGSGDRMSQTAPVLTDLRVYKEH